MRVHINGELHEEVRRIFEVLYLGSVISKDAGVSVDMRQIVNEGVATYGGMKSIWRMKEIGMKAKKGLYESVIVPTLVSSFVLREVRRSGSEHSPEKKKLQLS